MFSLICAWINGLVNNGEAGDLRRHSAHFDVAVMYCGLNALGTGDDIWCQGSQHLLRYWFVAESSPSHYLDQCWHIDDLALKNNHWVSLNEISKRKFIEILQLKYDRRPRSRVSFQYIAHLSRNMGSYFTDKTIVRTSCLYIWIYIMVRRHFYIQTAPISICRLASR